MGPYAIPMYTKHITISTVTFGLRLIGHFFHSYSSLKFCGTTSQGWWEAWQTSLPRRLQWSNHG